MGGVELRRSDHLGEFFHIHRLDIDDIWVRWHTY